MLKLAMLKHWTTRPKRDRLEREFWEPGNPHASPQLRRGCRQARQEHKSPAFWEKICTPTRKRMSTRPVPVCSVRDGLYKIFNQQHHRPMLHCYGRSHQHSGRQMIEKVVQILFAWYKYRLCSSQIDCVVQISIV